MNQKIQKWLRVRYQKTVNSIAFIPAFSVVAFLGIALLMLFFDYSDTGKHIKSNISWLSLKDASTARNIASTIVTGLVALLVFSFSQVMVLMSQSANKMSNRILTGLIVNRFQQVVLGFYVGTIVYALFLLSTIRDVNSGIYVPALSVYLLILFTILDIFLFIYFLHFVTQSVRYEIIIGKLQKETRTALEAHYPLPQPQTQVAHTEFIEIASQKTGYLQGGGKSEMISWCQEKGCTVEILPVRGSYVLKGTPLLRLYSSRPLKPKEKEDLLYFLDFYQGQSVAKNPAFGFHQLKEISINALKPGDAGTAVLCIHALADLFAFHLCHFPEINFKDDTGIIRVSIREYSFKELLYDCLLPIRDYAREDRIVLTALGEILSQLRILASHPALQNPIDALLTLVQKDTARLADADAEAGISILLETS